MHSEITNTIKSSDQITCDLFCRVVDNYGDIGVCWRLAHQLQREHGWAIRLWVDDLAVASRIIRKLRIDIPTQIVDEVEVLWWQSDTTVSTVADIVIEAFACDIPALYQQQMRDKPPVWINLEYLSAEPWVEDYHAKPSLHPQLGLKKTFFFPGFTEATGGLLREQPLSQRRNVFQSNAQTQSAFWETLGIPSDALIGQVKVSLFCYPHAPIASLLSSMECSEQPITLFVPMGVATKAMQCWFESHNIEVGAAKTIQQLTVRVIPFLSQSEYDQLLWACDFNFVRGEDSWIRALWSARPFIWQPYQQEEQTHLVKLEAFLDHYAPDNLTLQQAHHAWQTQGWTSALWDSVLNQLPDLTKHAITQTKTHEKQPDLASKLVIFCHNFLKTN